MKISRKGDLFLIGILVGLLLALILCWPKIKPKMVEIDLSKIISAYAVQSAKTEQPTAGIKQNFKVKLQQAMQKVAPGAIVVSKGSILSGHKLTDQTQLILAEMGVSIEKNAQTTTKPSH